MVRKHILFFSVLGVLAFIAPSVWAAPIQMLPPVQSGTDNIPCAADQGNKMLLWDGKHSIQCQSGAVIDSSGNMGIGTTDPAAKLDVVGGVKIGNDAAVCSVKKSGTVRANGGEMQFCDGSSWKRLATGPLFGGIFQTYLCDESSVYHGGGAGGCRRANVVTGKCTCPDGYIQQHINDFAAPVGSCPQAYYENRGMVQWVCVKP